MKLYITVVVALVAIAVFIVVSPLAQQEETEGYYYPLPEATTNPQKTEELQP